MGKLTYYWALCLRCAHAVQKRPLNPPPPPPDPMELHVAHDVTRGGTHGHSSAVVCSSQSKRLSVAVRRETAEERNQVETFLNELAYRLADVRIIVVSNCKFRVCCLWWQWVAVHCRRRRRVGARIGAQTLCWSVAPAIFFCESVKGRGPGGAAGPGPCMRPPPAPPPPPPPGFER